MRERLVGAVRSVVGNRFDRPAGVIAAAAVLLFLAELPMGLRAIALPAALFVPGHILVTTLFGPLRAPVGLTGVGLRVILSMAAYPLLALGIFIVDRLYTRTAVLIAVLAFAVIAALVGMAREYAAGGPVTGPPIELDRAWMAQARLPIVSLVLAFLVVAVGVEVAPRRPPVEFVQFHLSGRWALVDSAVPVERGFEPVVETEIVNRSRSTRRFEVAAYVDGVEDPSDRWVPVRVELLPGEELVVPVTGPLDSLACRTEVEIALRDLDGFDEHDPLTVFFRAADRTDC